MDDFLAEIRKIPPVTRVVCFSFLSISLSCMAGLVSGYKIIYTYSLAFEKLQIWRLYTSFFLGSSGINFIFELAMVYRTMDQLESGPFAGRSADLAWQLFVAGIGIMITSLPVNSMIFFRPFLLCITYVGSALAPAGAMTSIMGLIQLPIKYLPYIMLGMDLLMAGPGAVAQSLPGAVVGHLWWWGVWGPEVGGAGGILQQWSAAPRWLREWMGEGNAPLPGARTPDGATGANSGTPVRVIPPRRAADATAGAGTTRTTGYNWGGGGNRLGGS
ncbi:Der1-like family-domain-containing protein [Mycena galopus ATCC 62051]|nr:Der1-like family-domain-containing protein [Mycena galopus ATCC 62051]